MNNPEVELEIRRFNWAMVVVLVCAIATDFALIWEFAPLFGYLRGL